MNHAAVLKFEDFEAKDEKRKSPRKSVYLGEGITLCMHVGTKQFEGEAQDMSNMGIGVLILGAKPSHLQVGEKIIVEYTSHFVKGLKVSGVIANIQDVARRGIPHTRLGICFTAEEQATEPLTLPNRRGADRYLCPEFYRPMAMASSPFFFGDLIHFQIADFSPNGMTCFTSIDKKSIFTKGMELSFTISFPLLGQKEVRAIITSVSQSGSKVRIGTRFVGPSMRFLASLGEYLMIAHKHVPPATLRAQGYSVSTITNALSYEFAKTREDYLGVLNLRLLANQHAGRWQDKTLEDMANPFDIYSRQVIARSENRIVAVGRITFVEGIRERSHLHTVCGHNIPQFMWDTPFLEGGNFAIDPEYQRTDIFREMLKQFVRTGVESSASYLLIGADISLVPAYVSIGFKILEEKEVEPSPGWKVKSACMVLDLEKAATDPTYAGEKGHALFSPVMSFVQERQKK